MTSEKLPKTAEEKITSIITYLNKRYECIRRSILSYLESAIDSYGGSISESFYEEVIHCQLYNVPLFLNDENEYIAKIAMLRIKYPNKDIKEVLLTKESWKIFGDMLKESFIAEDQNESNPELIEIQAEIDTLSNIAGSINETEIQEKLRNLSPQHY